MHSCAFIPLILIAATGFAGETAYSALRVVGTERGEDALAQVIEIRGRTGNWTVRLALPETQTSLREIVVRNGRIRSETDARITTRTRTPIDLNKLNLDSDGALATVNQHSGEPVRDQLVEYTLSNAPDGNPIWTVECRNGRHGEPFSMQIAADTGTVLRKSLTPQVADADPAIVGEQVEDSDLAASQQRANGDQADRTKRNSRARAQLPAPPDIVEDIARRAETRAKQFRRFLPF
jgi:hypothetical protein